MDHKVFTSLRNAPDIENHEVAIAMMTIRAFFPFFHFMPQDMRILCASRYISNKLDKGRRDRSWFGRWFRF